MHPDQEKLLRLLERLPVHDARITPAAAHNRDEYC